MKPSPKGVWLDANLPPEEIRQQVALGQPQYFPVARGDLADPLGVVRRSRMPGRGKLPAKPPICWVRYAGSGPEGVQIGVSLDDEHFSRTP